MTTTAFTSGVTLSNAEWAQNVDTVVYNYLLTVAGTNTITGVGPKGISAYAAGMRFRFLPANTNTGATTLEVSSNGLALGAANIFWNGAACVGGEIRQNVPCEVEHDGTQFQIVGSASMAMVKGSSLTANRVPFAVGASGLLQDSANLTFNGSTLTVSSLAVSTFSGLLDISGASSGQIKFPATQNASADANTLDDYEEGTWAPSVGGSATYTVQTGVYTKIGNVVHVRFSLVINAIGTGNTTTISGLPFTANGSAGLAPSVFGGAATSLTSIQLAVVNATTTCEVRSTTAAANSNSTNAFFTNGTAIHGCGTYFV